MKTSTLGLGMLESPDAEVSTGSLSPTDATRHLAGLIPSSLTNA